MKNEAHFLKKAHFRKDNIFGVNDFLPNTDRNHHPREPNPSIHQQDQPSQWSSAVPGFRLKKKKQNKINPTGVLTGKKCSFHFPLTVPENGLPRYLLFNKVGQWEKQTKPMNESKRFDRKQDLINFDLLSGP